MTATAWWRDFVYRDGAMLVRKTGARVPVEPDVIGESLTWFLYFLRVEASRAGVRADGPRVWFAPDRPRPWYLVWPVARLAGLRIADSPSQADLGFFFEDVTVSEPPAAHGLTMINGTCSDVSKSRVARVFEEVAGRALRVDPAGETGPVVEKSEKNGAHDGRIRLAPFEAVPGAVYQRVVDNSAPDDFVEDLRCPTVGGEIPLVFLKRRPLARRFENANAQVRLLETNAVFSREELDMLKRFIRAMSLDWGGLDVLRDRTSGELWVVDVNKTDMGPPTALPLSRKMTASRAMARALRAYAESLVSGDASS